MYATNIYEHARTGTCETVDEHECRLTSHESWQVGTDVEPDPRPRVRPVERRSARRPTTYREIRAYVYARHGLSPRTGWIAHVKELNGLAIRPTHNRSAAGRIDACPPEGVRRSRSASPFRLDPI
jgi:hypothetical protein